MKFCFHPSVSFEGGETVARMQREPRDSRARAALQLGRFCSVTSRRRRRNLRQRTGGTLRMFTQGKATEEYAVIAGAEATSARECGAQPRHMTWERPPRLSLSVINPQQRRPCKRLETRVFPFPLSRPLFTHFLC